MTSSDRRELPLHEPVLRTEILEFLFESGPRSGGVFVDATLGLAGHASGILERSAPGGRLVGLDRDRSALDLAGESLAASGDRVTLVHTPFSRLDAVLDELGIDRV